MFGLVIYLFPEYSFKFVYFLDSVSVVKFNDNQKDMSY